jgi:hypothetical protein
MALNPFRNGLSGSAVSASSPPDGSQCTSMSSMISILTVPISLAGKLEVLAKLGQHMPFGSLSSAWPTNVRKAIPG